MKVLKFLSNFSPLGGFMERGAGNQKQFGDLKLDLTAKMLWHKGEPVSMPLKELELLCLLVERSG
jgi:DNA-binding response OmpR family regulator